MLMECLYSYSKIEIANLEGFELKYSMSGKISVGFLISSLLIQLPAKEVLKLFDASVIYFTIAKIEKFMVTRAFNCRILELFNPITNDCTSG